jgi:hypothetical protein
MTQFPDDSTSLTAPTKFIDEAPDRLGVGDLKTGNLIEIGNCIARIKQIKLPDTMRLKPTAGSPYIVKGGVFFIGQLNFEVTESRFGRIVCKLANNKRLEELRGKRNAK